MSRESQKETPQLMAPDWLLTYQRAMYVEGIGHLDQYGSYLNSFWEKGVVYFVRDYYYAEIQRQLDKGVSPQEVRPLVERLNALNSDILEWENGRSGRPGDRAL